MTRRIVKAITYAPKVEGVKDGTIRTTIRYRPEGKRLHEPGDIITLHGWAGSPYRSPWSWRRVAELERVQRLDLWIDRNTPDLMHWKKCWQVDGGHIPPATVETIAELDGIPGGAEEMESLMIGMYIDKSTHHDEGRILLIPLVRYVWRLPFLEVVE